MLRHTTLFFSSLFFLLGVILGLTGRESLTQSSVHAEHMTASAVDQMYRQLAVAQSPLGDGSTLLSQIASVTTPSVVHIQSERQSKTGGLVEETGSGVIMTSSQARTPFVVTNRHVIADAEVYDIRIQLHDGRTIHPTEVRADEKSDVAVMMIDEPNIQPARWGDSDTVNIGHMVLAQGSPFGLSQSVTFGIISAKGRRSLRLGESSDVINQDFLQTDAAINPGNSGGPLIDLSGRVIGINTAIASNSGGNEGIGFSIPSNLVRYVTEQLISHGKVRRAYLGVKLDPDFDLETAQKMGLDRVRGARVVDVYKNTPASRSGLIIDDVILYFGGVEVLDENHLINLVSLTSVQTSVQAIILRNGKRQTIPVVLGDRDDLEQRSEAPKLNDWRSR
ncbi:S1C family serine protease [Rubinisphaera margarita]|uniref:S1C family serine protease n=1 Tax=Rubinisphaera margarita TaxID=2909586 RepID=UPI001EE7FDEC|nr:trypsin-like peptidase domain-containing protein [Rubinisphaera margarita]MCG6156717.1 trypsin-like peptidase domain-containing protein [Rubinisphaera margarita]